MIQEHCDDELFNILANDQLADINKIYSLRKISENDIVQNLFSEPNISTETKIQSEFMFTPKKSKKDQKTNKTQKKLKQEATIINNGILKGHWHLEQNKRYHWFLELYSNNFINKHLRRMDKIFISMQKFIKTRQAEQCRSHHQKMQKKHGSFQKLIQELRMQHYNSHDVDLVFEDIKINNFESSYQKLIYAPEKLSKKQDINKQSQTQYQSTDGEQSQKLQIKQKKQQIFINPLKQMQQQQFNLLQQLVF